MKVSLNFSRYSLAFLPVFLLIIGRFSQYKKDIRIRGLNHLNHIHSALYIKVHLFHCLICFISALTMICTDFLSTRALSFSPYLCRLLRVCKGPFHIPFLQPLRSGRDINEPKALLHSNPIFFSLLDICSYNRPCHGFGNHLDEQTAREITEFV